MLTLLKGKDVLVGVIDVANTGVETPKQVADLVKRVLQFVPAKRLFLCTNCGMAPMRREIAVAKLQALGAGAALARERYRSAKRSRSGRSQPARASGRRRGVGA